MPSTADVIARKLFDAGCRHAFGIPGGEVLTIMDALVRAGITFTLAKHENAAGFMAEGVHHATSSPVILLATVGPGVSNAVNVIANAYQDRVPLVVLTGCVDDSESISYTHQVLDQQALLRPITKGTFRAVTDASDIIVDKAWPLRATDARVRFISTFQYPWRSKHTGRSNPPCAALQRDRGQVRTPAY